MAAPSSLGRRKLAYEARRFVAADEKKAIAPPPRR